MAKQKNKAHILFRYGVVTLLLVLMATAIGASLTYTTTLNASDWNKAAEQNLNIDTVLAPERGSILASNGSILACNALVWDIKIDMQHSRMTDKKLDMVALDSLADYLDNNYPRPANLKELPPDSIKKYSWYTRLHRELEKPVKKRRRALMIARGVEDDVFDKLVKEAPLIKNFKGERVPIYRKSRYIRTQPYGMMARYSIGVVNEDSTRNYEKHGYSGLEKDLDSLLYGKPGLARSITFNTGTGDWTIKKPQRGYDVVTTIDLQIQDILEQELLERCSATNAEWGTAMVMEVATGEIKAISNFERRDDGTYGEAYNRAVTCYEPGSVVKPISLLIAFEDGLITSNNNTVDCSKFQRTTDPHAPTVKTIPEVMGWSSNTGVARIIFRGYADKPETFRDRWARLKMFEKMHSGIAEERPVRMKRLLPFDETGQHTMTERHLDLARQSFGYALDISPLYLLSIYNAIANNGHYVRPHLVRALRLPSGRDSVLHHAPILDQVCTPEHARMLRECLRKVVTGGTARSAKLDEVVPLAGKTGTCYPVFKKEEGHGYDKSKRRFAFAGFFPYDHPRYSCVVLVQAPAGSGGAGSISGKVLSRVAERMFARGMLGDTPGYNTERIASVPVLTNGEGSALYNLQKLLGITAKRLAGPDPSKTPEQKVPSVINCDARTALRQLEQRGLNVVLRGTGRVTSQSIPAGSAVRKGARIILQLN